MHIQLLVSIVLLILAVILGHLCNKDQFKNIIEGISEDTETTSTPTTSVTSITTPNSELTLSSEPHTMTTEEVELHQYTTKYKDYIKDHAKCKKGCNHPGYKPHNECDTFQKGKTTIYTCPYVCMDSDTGNSEYCKTNIDCSSCGLLLLHIDNEEERITETQKKTNAEFAELMEKYKEYQTSALKIDEPQNVKKFNQWMRLHEQGISADNNIQRVTDTSVDFIQGNDSDKNSIHYTDVNMNDVMEQHIAQYHSDYMSNHTDWIGYSNSNIH